MSQRSSSSDEELCSRRSSLRARPTRRFVATPGPPRLQTRDFSLSPPPSHPVSSQSPDVIFATPSPQNAANPTLCRVRVRPSTFVTPYPQRQQNQPHSQLSATSRGQAPPLTMDARMTGSPGGWTNGNSAGRGQTVVQIPFPAPGQIQRGAIYQPIFNIGCEISNHYYYNGGDDRK